MTLTKPHTETSVVTAMAVVTTIGDELVELVTTCVPKQGQEWLEFLLDVDTQGKGFDADLPLTLAKMTDIHHSWGVAWYDQHGVSRTLGSYLVYAERALEILHGHLHADDTEVTPADTDPSTFTDVIISAETPDDGPKSEQLRLQRVPAEAHLILELHGVLPTDDGWAIGWNTSEGVTVILGRDHNRAVDTLMDLRRWNDQSVM